MSYQVLARKWRPQNFKQMVGQEHVLKALIHALESQRLHHAYLFTGTRGVGKTTIGRILAKCLSCHQGITAEPCGECGACTNIAEGRYVDLIEIDAASRTKVEDMRELLDNVQYAPSEGRFKIYLIDEVHMLSQSSFNALLKTLEEPPEHVKFLFATTDPQKLPVTILSRCLQFNLKNMSPERIVGHLQNILSQEGVTFEEMALWALARAADGSMRDALSLTDQAIAYGNHVLSEQGVSAMLGTVDQKKIYRILDSLLAKDAANMLQEVKALAEFSPNYASVLAAISEILHRVAIEQAVPGAIDNSMGDQEQVVRFARSLCAEDVQLFYQVALVSRKDLAITPDPKTGLEMALLRMMAFQMSPASADQAPLNNSSVEVVSGEVVSDDALPIESTASAEHAAQEVVVETEYSAIDNHIDTSEHTNIDESLDAIRHSEIDANNAQTAQPNSDDLSSSYSEGEESKKKADSSPNIELDENSKAELNKPDNSVNVDQQSHSDSNSSHAELSSPESKPSFEQTIEPSASLRQEPLAESKQEPSAVLQQKSLAGSKQQPSAELQKDPPSVPPQQLAEKPDNQDVVRVASEGWNKEVSQLGLTGMTLNLMLNAVLVCDAGSITINFEQGHFRLLNASHEKRIREAVEAYYGADRSVQIIEGLVSGQETPMMWRERVKAEMFAQAKSNIQSDPFVQQMLNEFEGVLLEHSIESLGEIV